MLSARHSPVGLRSPFCLVASFASFASLSRYFAAVQHDRAKQVFRGSSARGSKPCNKLSLNFCKPLLMRVPGIFRQGFNTMSEVCTSASPYLCGFQRFTFSPCSKEHCRVLNPCMHLHIRAPQTAVNPNFMASTASGNPYRVAQAYPAAMTINTFRQ